MPNIRGEQIQDESLTSADIKDGTITGADIANNAIDASKIDIRYKEAVTAVVDLPILNNTAGDVRLVSDVKALYTWTGTAWVVISPNQLAITEGETIATYLPCYIKSDGKTYIASKDDTTKCTVCGLKSGTNKIQTSGPIVNPSWNLTPGLICYLGNAGAIIQDTDLIQPINNEAVVVLGKATSATSIDINIGTPQLFGEGHYSVIETGSNANGSYVKYGNGIMECWANVTGLSTGAQTYTFPQAFADTNYILTFGGRYGSGASGVVIPNEWSVPARTSSTWSGGCISYDGGAWRAHYFSYHAIGKWSSAYDVDKPTVSIGRGIIESGSNANGSYVKYEDGTMECWWQSTTLMNLTVVSGSNYYNSLTSQPFPQIFSSPPVVSPSMVTNGGFMSGTASTITTSSTYLYFYTNGSGASGYPGYRAVGRWQAATNTVGDYTYGQGIIESGSNSNGNWIKFDNGTMIQWGIATANFSSGTWTTNDHNIGTYGWSLYSMSRGPFSFPAEFLDANTFVTIIPGSNQRFTQQGAITSTTYTFVWHNYAQTSADQTFRWQAIGKWK